MRIRFTENNQIFKAYKDSEYEIHDIHEENNITYYYFDTGDGQPPFCVTEASVKAFAVIEEGEGRDVLDRLVEEGNDE